MIRKAFYYLTHWETWHWFAKYIIIGPAWVWLCIKAKSFWFFTPSNPGITFGGFLGETKSEVYNKLPADSYPRSIYINPKQSLCEIEQEMERQGLTYPVAVKPNVGMMGLMFRKVESRQQLRQYHSVMKVDYIVQEFIEYPIEVSVFYYRMPGEKSGRISGFIRKELMEVVGDGSSTLKDLIYKYPRAQYRLRELFSKHEDKLNDVFKKGEHYILSEALNLSRGGRLVNLKQENDQRLLDLFDRFSHHTGFLYGRYDIKCRSVEDLKQGRNFSILEFNGCGGEAHHVYSGYSFLHACWILIQHWVVLYKISTKNKRNGFEPWAHNDGLEFMRKARKHFDELKCLDSRFYFAPEKEKRISKTILPGLATAELQQHVA